MATVLIADDESANRELLAYLLRHAGHESIEAADGEAALRLARERRPDVAIVDLNMPRTNGATLLKELRRDPGLRDLAIVLYTASGPSAALRDFMQLFDVRHAIPKPCQPAQALAVIESAVAQAESSRKLRER